jgi:hypothetical protein
MSAINTVKTAIQNKLNGLVPATLGEVQVDDLKTSLLDRDYGKFPVAVLTTPEVSADYLTNHDNIRTLHFPIVVLVKAEDISSATQVEALIEALIDAFDTDYTLGGAAEGGVEPSTSVPEAVLSRGKTYIAFTISIKARTTVQV